MITIKRIDSIERGPLRVMVANTFMSRFLGLLPHRGVADDEALLLSPGGSIHTLGMRFPIDVVFLDARMQVLRIARNVLPWRFVSAPRHTRHVLEVGSQRAHANGWCVGMTLSMR